jgi:hypothetical protein
MVATFTVSMRQLLKSVGLRIRQLEKRERLIVLVAKKRKVTLEIDGKVFEDLGIGHDVTVYPDLELAGEVHGSLRILKGLKVKVVDIK